MQREVHLRSRKPVPAQNAIKGIGLMLVALALFSCLDTTAKYMATVAQVPLTQVVWLRFMSQLLLIIFVAGIVAVPRLLITRRPKQQLIRSTLMLFSTLLNFVALRHLRLDHPFPPDRCGSGGARRHDDGCQCRAGR